MADLRAMLAVLPPDFGDPADVALLVDLIDKWARITPHNPVEGVRLGEFVQARAPELKGFLATAVARYADRATDALTEVDPRLLTNFAYVEAASRGVRGVNLLPEQGWRRETWTVAAGGGGTRKSTRALRAMMQATLDFRMAALAQGWLGLDGPVSAQDHDYLIAGRGRFAWVSRRVAQLILANSGLPEKLHDDLEALWSYTNQICNGPQWMTGRCQSVPLSPGARALASELAIEPGSLAGKSYVELLTTRRSETHPYVLIDGIVLPARGDAAMLKLESAVFAFVRRRTDTRNSGLALEGAVRDVLAMVPGLEVQPEPVYITVNAQNHGETDVFATAPRGRAILGEVKAHVTVEGQATTDKSYSEGIGHLAEQLRKRREAYAAGEAVRLLDGTVINRRRSGEPLTLGATLHEYSGAPWRSPIFTGTTQAAPTDVPVFPVVDLQLIAAVMHDADDLCAYLETRQRVFSQGMAGAGDELDILCWYLRRGAAGCAAELDRAEGKYGIIFSPKDIPIPEQVAAEPAGTAQLRQKLLALPHAADW